MTPTPNLPPELVERVARAIANCDYPPQVNDIKQKTWIDSAWLFHTDQAEAALQAAGVMELITTLNQIHDLAFNPDLPRESTMWDIAQICNKALAAFKQGKEEG